MADIHQKLARKAGDLATDVLFSQAVGAQYQLTAVQLQNADIAQTLGTEADPTGLLRVFGEAVSNPKYRDQLPTTAMTGLQLKDEYLGQLEAEKRRSVQDTAGPVGDLHLLDMLETLKSRIAADVYKQKNGFYTGMAGWVESLSTVQGRAKLAEKQLPVDVGTDRLPVVDAGYVGVLPAIQAAARLKLAHEVITLRQQGADAADIAKAKAAWEEACLAEPTSGKTGGNIETLAQNFLNTRQLDFARKDIANPNASAELKLGSQFQLTNHMGHVLTCLVEADPSLLQRPEVLKAVEAMPKLADAELQAVKQSIQALNAGERKAPEGVLRPNLLELLDAAITPAPKATKLEIPASPQEALETVKSLGQRLWEGVKDIVQKARGFITQAIAKLRGQEVAEPTVTVKSEVVKAPEAPGDVVLTGIAAAAETLAQVYPQNQPRIGESVKEALDGYVARQAKDLGLGEHSALIQSAVQATAAKTQQQAKL